MEIRSRFLFSAALLAFAGSGAALDECLPNPCGHGNCLEEAGGFVCSCDPGWTGPLCDNEDLLPTPVVTATTICRTENFSADSGLGSLAYHGIGDADQGGASVVDGRLRLTADGTSFYHGSDNGGFVHRAVNGDFRAQVKLTGLPVDAGGGYRRTGLTVRTGTGPNDARIYVEYLPLHPSYNQPALMFDYRNGSGTASELASTKLNAVPSHLSIDRRGDKFTVGYSTDGVNWVKPAGAAGGTITLALPATLEVGMMAASYDATLTFTSEFDDFAVCQVNSQPLPALPPPVACVPGRPLDLVYLLDASGSATTAFPDGPTKLDASRQAIAELNARVESDLPGSRVSLIVMRGGAAPSYVTGAGATVVRPLTASFAEVEAGAAAIDVTTIGPTVASPLALGLELARLRLVDDRDPDHQPVLVYLGDGSTNVDIAKAGPQYYKAGELQSLSILAGGDHRSIGEVGWLGNWNGPIGTWDGQALADAMHQVLLFKREVPELILQPLGLFSDAAYRPDLLSFMADFGAGQRTEATDGASLSAAVATLWEGLYCADDIDSCQPNPCVHGSCRDMAAGFRCTCELGFTGTTCDEALPLADHLGMTWTVVGSPAFPGVVWVGSDSQTDAYHGDTAPEAVLPILCLRVDGRPAPPGIVTGFYQGWAKGEVALSEPVSGTLLTSLEVANQVCSSQLGPRWRIAEHHDGFYGPKLVWPGGWSFFAHGSIPPGIRFWTHINDQPSNTWN